MLLKSHLFLVLGQLTLLIQWLSNEEINCLLCPKEMISSGRDVAFVPQRERGELQHGACRGARPCRVGPCGPAEQGTVCFGLVLAAGRA